jgi:type II secretory pathway pseudopilin PulG
MALFMATGSRGFTYLGLMLFMVIAGIGLAMAGKVWHTEVQREKERELLFVGDQFRQAIGSYYENTPSGAKQYPLSLEQLLNDDRFPNMKHHLRRIYIDPMTGQAEWGLEKQGERIVGIYSLSQQHPLKTAGFVPEYEFFAQASQYQAWRFSHIPGTLKGAAGEDVSENLPSGEPGGLITAKDGSAVPASPVPEQPQENADRQQDCVAQRDSDTAICSSKCKEKGPGIECNLCQTSILARYMACLKS